MRLLVSIVVFVCSFISTAFANKLTITPEETKSLAALRKEVRSIVTQPYMFEDPYLVSWLRAKKNSVEDTSEAIRKVIKWREENSMDTILDDVQVWKKFSSSLPYRTNGVAKDGTPALEILFGKWDLRKVSVSGEGNAYLRYHARMFEEISNKSREIAKTKPHVYGYYSITDFSEYAVQKFACLSCMPLHFQSIKNFENYYSKELHIMYVLNTPRIFDAFYGLVAPAFSEFNRKRLKFGGLNREVWSNELFEIFTKDQLLRVFGGTKSLAEKSTQNIKHTTG